MVKNCVHWDKKCKLLELNSDSECNEHCKFFKTEEQFQNDVDLAEERLIRKGLKRAFRIDENGKQIVSAVPVEDDGRDSI